MNNIGYYVLDIRSGTLYGPWKHSSMAQRFIDYSWREGYRHFYEIVEVL